MLVTLLIGIQYRLIEENNMFENIDKTRDNAFKIAPLVIYFMCHLQTSIMGSLRLLKVLP